MATVMSGAGAGRVVCAGASRHAQCGPQSLAPDPFGRARHIYNLDWANNLSFLAQAVDARRRELGQQAPTGAGPGARAGIHGRGPVRRVGGPRRRCRRLPRAVRPHDPAEGARLDAEARTDRGLCGLAHHGRT